MMCGGKITGQLLQQTICCLQTLNKVPEMPKENVLVIEID
jgi:hypothetical protein